MKIIKEPLTKLPTFCEISQGDCFGFSGNAYVKMRTALTCSHSNTRVNALRLGDGYCGLFADNTPVTLYPDAVVTLIP